MADVEFYNVGDYVTVENQNNLKLEIGRIEDIKKHQNIFTYILFYKPEETQAGRQDHQGKNEILKTTVNNEESIIYISAKIEVLKLSDYAQLSQEEKASNRFVCRQNYDPVEHNFAPELEPECFCGKILNPDEELAACVCEKVYHQNCVTAQNSTCACGNSILSTVEGIRKKRKLDDDKSVLLKNNKEEEYYELFANALEEAATDKDEANKNNNHDNHNNYTSPTNQKSLNDKRAFPHLEIKKNSSHPLTPKGSAKKSSRKEFCNIDDEAYQRVKTALENFSKTYQNKNLADADKARYFMKEKYYKSLLYGIEEVKEKQKIAASNSLLDEEERTIAFRDPKENYKKAEDLALSIEATVWHTMNKSKTGGVDPSYNLKNRELLNYLTDDGNYELRLSVLSGQRKPESLCKASAKDLMPKGLSEKVEKKRMDALKQSLLPDEVKIIAKSHKGETVIENKEPEAKKVQLINDMDPIIEDNTALLAQIVKNISNGPTMNEDSRKTEEYDPLNEDENAFDEFKLHKKPLHLPNLNGLGPYEESPEPMQVEEKKSAAKKYEEPIQLADIENNKLIDQEVLKNAVNVFFDKTYSNVSERLNHHLRSDIADSILEEINKKHKTE